MRLKRPRKKQAVALTLPASLRKRTRPSMAVPRQRRSSPKSRTLPPTLLRISRRRRSRTRRLRLTHRAYGMPLVTRGLAPRKLGHISETSAQSRIQPAFSFLAWNRYILRCCLQDTNLALDGVTARSTIFFFWMYSRSRWPISLSNVVMPLLHDVSRREYTDGLPAASCSS